MYLYHFGLKELPFSLTPNTQFFLGLPSHHEALQTLITALKMGEGFVKVTGEVGTGKTLLCRKLMNDLGDEFVTAYIPNPYLNPDELRHAVAQELAIDSENCASAALTQKIQQKLIDICAQGKQLVLILDEAQVLPDESLEALRLFTNLETENSKLMQLVLFAQPELDNRLEQHNFRQIKQRITFSIRLDQLQSEQIQAYLHHRMTIAGYQGMPIFTLPVCKLLFQASQGTPRIINILAHKCLMLAFGQGTSSITTEHAKQAINDTEATHRQSAIATPTALFARLLTDKKAQRIMLSLAAVIAIATSFWLGGQA
ncbi:MSHA biogenesis protein MshM [Catenovulum agarivorans DS-2]|uniref:MSHA biogenesis protein MshM n=1 Tax=Catenovulum agarivorans DS-2 TaxID=1328313 RepID=W7Q7I9_9ALTE|nr:AAA family ATPase [Catenovulum agarivorans]EWH08744.1 MSHA biogenesis protein MshM [Catenovulum agarivorans DS-2]